jgi:PKD repeat protein
MRKFDLFILVFLFLGITIKLDAQVNLNKGLVAWFPFNGNANDASGNGHNGTVNSGTLTNDRYGKANSAFSFSGSVGITVPSMSNASTPGATVSLWIKTTSTLSAIQVVQGVPSTIYLNVFTYGHYFGVFDGTGGNNASSDESKTQVNTGDWYNITTKNDGTKTYVYVNGVLEKSYSETYSKSSGNFVIASYNAGYATGYNGSEDDVRIYYRALSDSEVLAIYQMPKVLFGIKNTCITDSARFTDSSFAVSNSTYFWNFGDNTTSTKKSPAHLYAKPGTYKVTLKITSPATSSDSLTKTIVVYPLPKASFSTSINYTNYQVGFTPADTNNAVYSWDFGDTTYSYLKKPVHTYKYPGTFTVILNTKNANGCDSIYSKTIMVYQVPKGAFSYKNTCSNYSTVFTDSSTAPASSTYLWSFGDNTTSGAKNTSHIYSIGGTYKVVLKITSMQGYSDSAIKTITINQTPRASFTYTINKYKISFVPVDTTLLSYAWDFGDTSQSTAKRPVHYYNGYGSYTVTLTTKNSSGCDSTYKKTIVIYQNPVAAFAAKNACIGDSVLFSNQSTAPLSSTYKWNFGDNTSSTKQNPSHLYSKAGTYNVTLKITSQFGGSDSITKPVSVFTRPGATFSYSLFKYKASFIPRDTAAYSYSWDFGDTSNSASKKPTHTYSNSGTYVVTLITKNASGCDSTYKATLTIYESPSALFSAQNACEGEIVQFTDLSTAPPSSIYSWNFGDNTTSNQKSPGHLYTGYGTFKVGLKITNGSGVSDSFSKSVTVYPAPSASFRAHINKYRVEFIPADSTLLNYSWNFGDSSISTSKRPVHTYSYSATFNVKLTVKNANGCDSTLSKSYFIDGNTGIENLNLSDNAILIYPNPVSDGKLHFILNYAGSSIIEIYNLEGQSFYIEKISSISNLFERSINVSNYPKGIYFFTIKTQTGIICKKISIQ